MLKKIPTDKVTLGMFIHALDGPWLTHPFWRTRFVLEDPAELAALHASGVPSVWIDVDKGCDASTPVVDAAAPVAATVPAPTADAPGKTEPRPSPRQASVSGGTGGSCIEDELQRAGEVLKRARVAVSALFREARLGKAVNVEHCLPVVEDVTASLSRNPSAFLSLARLKTRDDYTYMHSVAVCGLMVALAREAMLSDSEVREAGLAGLLHDVGKMHIPLDVLNKPGPLTDSEFGVMRSHTEHGFQMLQSGSSVPMSALDVCLHHHERMDGQGYPHRLVGDQISPLARMGAICDVYDAVTSLRPYKAAWDPAVAVQRMSQWKGHFDPQLFATFVRSVGIYPTGSLVRMDSGRLAVVVEQNPQALVKPRVRVFFSTKSKMPIPLQLIDLSSSSTTDFIVGREAIEDWQFPHLEQLWRNVAPG